MQKYAIGSRMLCTYPCYNITDEPVIIVGYEPPSLGDALYEVKVLRAVGSLKAGETCKCFEHRLTEAKVKQITVAEIEKALGYGVEIIAG
jgi:hypothetical protein